jgi:hypothetical protein
VGNLWVIDEGLKLNEHVVIEGLLKVRDGMTVNPKLAPAGPETGKESPPTAPATTTTPTSAKTGG